MAQKNGIYKCEICKNIVSVIEAHQGDLVCCGQPMKLFEEKTAKDEGREKHVPVMDGLKIKVGSNDHPMQTEHWIELIQAFIDNKLVVEKILYPGDKPEIELLPEYKGKKISARALCNLHGLWKS